MNFDELRSHFIIAKKTHSQFSLSSFCELYFFQNSFKNN